MPQEDFPTDAAARCAEFFIADLHRDRAKAALNSVRVGKITTDDGTGEKTIHLFLQSNEHSIDRSRMNFYFLQCNAFFNVM